MEAHSRRHKKTEERVRGFETVSAQKILDIKLEFGTVISRYLLYMETFLLLDVEFPAFEVDAY